MPVRELSRRRFLLACVALAGTVSLLGCMSVVTEPPPGLAVLTPRQWTVLDEAARILLPDGPGRKGAGEIPVATLADRLLATADAHLKGQLARLLDAFETMPFLALHCHRFTAMRPSEQEAYLAAWIESPLPMLRQGGIALNKLCAMVFYMDPRSWPQIAFPGPWVGRLDVGLGLDNQGNLPANPNPHIYEVVS